MNWLLVSVRSFLGALKKARAELGAQSYTEALW